MDTAKDRVVAAAREVALVGYAPKTGELVKTATAQELGVMMRHLRETIKELDDALAGS